MTYEEFKANLEVLLEQDNLPDKFESAVSALLSRTSKLTGKARLANFLLKLSEIIKTAEETGQEETDTDYLDDFISLCTFAGNDPELQNEFKLITARRHDEILNNILTRIPNNKFTIQNEDSATFYLSDVVDNVINNNLDIEGKVINNLAEEKIKLLKTYFNKIVTDYLAESANESLSLSDRRSARENLQAIQSIQQYLNSADILATIQYRNITDQRFPSILSILKKILGHGKLVNAINAFQAKIMEDTPDIHEGHLAEIQTELFGMGKKYPVKSLFFLPSAERTLGIDMPIILYHLYQWIFKTPALKNWKGFTDLADRIKLDLKNRLDTHYKKNKVFPDYKHNLTRALKLKHNLDALIDEDDPAPQENPTSIFKTIIAEYSEVLETKPLSLNGTYLKQLKGTLDRFRGAMNDGLQVEYSVLQINHHLKQYLHDKQPGSVKKKWANRIMAKANEITTGIDATNATQKMRQLVHFLMQEEKKLVLYDAKVYFGFITFGSHRLHTALKSIIEDLKPFLPEVTQDFIDVSMKTSQLAKDLDFTPKEFGYKTSRPQVDLNDLNDDSVYSFSSSNNRV